MQYVIPSRSASKSHHLLHSGPTGRRGKAAWPIEKRFNEKIAPQSSTGCIEWTGAANAKGYGRINYLGQPVAAHRLSYTIYKGQIPEGYVIDHLCRNPRCVNPDHLEAVTQSVNVRRGEHVKDTCKHGHHYTPETTAYDGKGHRSCRICRRSADQLYKSKKRGTSNAL